MALSSLSFRAGSAPAGETEAGVTVFDGKPWMFHQWEFKTMLKYMAVTTEAKKAAKVVNQVVDALRGDALQVAMDTGIENLMKEDGWKTLIENMRRMLSLPKSWRRKNFMQTDI